MENENTVDGFQVSTGRATKQTTTRTVTVVNGYEPLFDTLMTALEQSQGGKGAERHAKGLPFVDQPIMRIPTMLGGVGGFGGVAYQVMKKSQEAVGMHERGKTDAAIAEMRGAIVYAAACILHLEGTK